MALNSSGQISLGGSTTGESIALELGRSATDAVSLTETDVRSLAGVSTGAISLSNLYGGLEFKKKKKKGIFCWGGGGWRRRGGGGGGGGVFFFKKKKNKYNKKKKKKKEGGGGGGGVDFIYFCFL